MPAKIYSIRSLPGSALANSVPTHRITAIFPYLAIATTTVLHGFELTSVLPEGGAGQPEHVAPILRMFFDGDGKPIDRATFFRGRCRASCPGSLRR